MWLLVKKPRDGAQGGDGSERAGGAHRPALGIPAQRRASLVTNH